MSFKSLKEELKRKIDLISEEDLKDLNQPDFYKKNFKSLLNAWYDSFTPIRMRELERQTNEGTASSMFVDAINWWGRRKIASMFGDDPEDWD